MYDAHKIQRSPQKEKANSDLRITNRAKDMFIEQLQKERQGLLDQVAHSSHRIGELETRLLQLAAPERGPEQDTSQR